MNKIKDILFRTDDPKSLIIGMGLAVIVVITATYIGKSVGIFMGMEKSPISTIMLAIILGIIIRNTIGVPQSFKPGIKFCLENILMLGIILLGAGLSIFAVVKVIKIGVLGIGIIAACITAGVTIIYFLARWFKLDERLGTLIAVGTGICGATAIVATGPIIKAKEEEIAYAVTTITIFGIIAMFAYPYITHFSGLTDIQAGIFMGTSIHDTSQVVGAGLIYDQLWDSEGAASGGNIAILTKLLRNTFIMVVIPLMAFLYMRGKLRETRGKISPLNFFPMFILGFILMVILRSTGDYAIVDNAMFWNPESWNNLLAAVKYLATTFLAVAMAGVGLGTNIKEFKNIGLKPFFVGLFGATAVGVISFVLVYLLAPYLII